MRERLNAISGLPVRGCGRPRGSSRFCYVKPLRARLVGAGHGVRQPSGTICNCHPAPALEPWARNGRKPEMSSARLAVVTPRPVRRARSVAIPIRLTTRLADPESMARGLDQFTSNLRRYTIIVKRSSFNWDTGKAQDPNIVLFEDEPPVLDGVIDTKILKSKHVTILATTNDNGNASIDLT